MTKKKYRQQSDINITPSSESASSSSSVPVSHSDDEGNVIIDTTTETDPAVESAPAYEPIPELVETETSYLEGGPSNPTALALALVEDEVPSNPVALVEEGVTLNPVAIVALVDVDLATALVDVDVATALVKEEVPSNPIALVKEGATSTSEPRGIWSRFKSWFGRCSSCCCCCGHRRRHRDVSGTS
jgi:hypothetical protein